MLIGFAIVLYGPAYAPVPVKTDQADVEDGGSAEEDIQCSMNITPEGSKHPVANQLPSQGEGHDEQSYTQIC